MAPFSNALDREQSLLTGLLEALYNLSEQSSPEGRWRVQALIGDLREKAPGALIGALRASHRNDPDLGAAIELLGRSAPKVLDPASARRMARSARELMRFALRRRDEGRSKDAFVQKELQRSLSALERSQRRLLRTLEDHDGERAMILRDLDEARGHLMGLREAPVETLSDNRHKLLAMVG
ncbi:MAG: hypothetical protein ACI9VR_004127 [Cognaticolwellia sp.]|jgi:hypothetical protein